MRLLLKFDYNETSNMNDEVKRMVMLLPAAFDLKVLLPSSTVFRSLATALPSRIGISPFRIGKPKRITVAIPALRKLVCRQLVRTTTVLDEGVDNGTILFPEIYILIVAHIVARS